MILDIAMPLTLFCVTLVSLFLNQKTERRLKTTLEEKEFGIRDAVLLVGMMTCMIVFIAAVRQISLILMILFLFAYSMLLFTFGYVFSKNRWYVGVVPPVVFVLLYVFFKDTAIWSSYLVSIYGVVFAILITLYLASLFSWVTTGVFGILITIMDIVLVLVTGTMIEVASAARSLNLPIMVGVPLVPPNATVPMMYLGLGDFFFAGLLAIQTFKKYGKYFAVLSVAAMAISFFMFAAFMLNYKVPGFPGTLMIIAGWAPLVVGKILKDSHAKNVHS